MSTTVVAPARVIRFATADWTHADEVPGTPTSAPRPPNPVPLSDSGSSVIVTPLSSRVSPLLTTVPAPVPLSPRAPLLLTRVRPPPTVNTPLKSLATAGASSSRPLPAAVTFCRFAFPSPSVSFATSSRSVSAIVSLVVIVRVAAAPPETCSASVPLTVTGVTLPNVFPCALTVRYVLLLTVRMPAPVATAADEFSPLTSVRVVLTVSLWPLRFRTPEPWTLIVSASLTWLPLAQISWSAPGPPTSARESTGGRPRPMARAAAERSRTARPQSR